MSNDVKRYKVWETNLVLPNDSEVVLVSDYAALEAENARLVAQLSAELPAWRRKDGVLGCKQFMTQKCFDAQSPQMKANYEPFRCASCSGKGNGSAEREGGEREAVEVVGSLVGGEFYHHEQNGAKNTPLMTVAQHQRITAAMAAEVERLLAERDVEIERLHMDYNEACADAMGVARELTALKAQPAAHDQGEVQRLRVSVPEGWQLVPVEMARKLVRTYENAIIDAAHWTDMDCEVAQLRAILASTGQEVKP